MENVIDLQMQEKVVFISFKIIETYVNPALYFIFVQYTVYFKVRITGALN